MATKKKVVRKVKEAPKKSVIPKKAIKTAVKKVSVPLDYEKPLDTVESKPSPLHRIINWFK